MKLYFSLWLPQRGTQRKHHGFRLCFLLIVRLGGAPMAKKGSTLLGHPHKLD
jgi:hypothetical protein